MTQKQKEALSIVLKKVSDGNLLANDALTIIEGIVDSKDEIRIVPSREATFPWENMEPLRTTCNTIEQ